MKTKIVTTFLLSLIILAVSCKKADDVNPNDVLLNTVLNAGNHTIDSRLVGTWMWTKGSDAAYYDDNGTYHGAAYGLATEYKINANGSGTCFNHVYSSVGGATGLEVNISSQGFFESDDQGHLGYFPISGTYLSSSGVNRSLTLDELWDVTRNTENKFLYQKLVITTQGGRQCFQVTSTDGITDTYFRVK